MEREPGAGAAWDRLAALALEEGRAEDAARLRRRKAELGDARDRYHRICRQGDQVPHAVELAKLAETLGRRFEARAFWLLSVPENRDNPEVREALARTLGFDDDPRDDGPSLALAVGPNILSDRRSAEEGAEVSGPVPLFRDEAGAAGLSAFVFDRGKTPSHQIPEDMSGGVGLVDFDGDGWVDVYAVQGGPFPPPRTRPSTGDRLFRNRGDGTFEDVTERSGIASMTGGYGFGMAVGDVDNDGDADLFITRWRSYALYRNRGNGTFEDATAKAGLGGDRDFPTSAAFADLDGDGDLDLYVCHYLAWDDEKPTLCTDPKTGAIISCNPRGFRALPDHVFRNDGGRFVDVTEHAGIVDADGRGLGVAADDLDGDGKVDLYVANDGTANYLFHNVGGFRFEEVGHASGAAANAAGGYQAGMGVARGDLDGDGLADLAVTNFYGESTTFFQDLGHGVFADRTAALGLAAPCAASSGSELPSSTPTTTAGSTC